MSLYDEMYAQAVAQQQAAYKPPQAQAAAPTYGSRYTGASGPVVGGGVQSQRTTGGGAPPVTTSPMGQRYTGAAPTAPSGPTGFQVNATQAARSVNDNMLEYFKQRNSELAAQNTTNQSNIAAQRSTALAEAEANNAQMREQAERTLQSPINVPISIPTQAPANPVDNVSVNPALQGQNNATGAFFVSPESTQSQFAVGAPVGGGFIGARLRKSTDDLKSKNDRLGGGNQGDF